MTTRVRISVPLLAIAFALLLPGTSSAVFTNVESVVAASAQTSSAKSATVTCPAGKYVTSAGADVTPGDGHVLIDDIRPSSDLKSVTARAIEDETGTAATWFVAAHAICAPAPAGLVRIAATSPSSSAAKVVTAACPSDKKLLGTGAEMTTSAGQVVIDGIKPSSTLDSVTVNAFEDGTGTTSAWTITAYAICAAVPGLELRGTTTDAGSPASDVLDSECNPGTTLVGMGGEINAGGGQVVIDALYADRAGASGFAAFEDDTGYAGNWSLTGYAICAPYATRRSATVSTPETFAERTIGCPQDTRVTGAGGELTGGMGEAFLNHLDPGSGEALRAIAWQKSNRTWSLTGHAICTATPAGYEVVSDVAAGQTTAEVIVTCPAGKRVLGGGVRSPGLGNDGSVQAIAPSVDLTSVRIAVSEDEFGAGDVWTLTGLAMCASPPPGLQLISRTTASNTDEDHKQVAATCPAGKHLIGSGAAVLPATGHVIIDDLRPSPGLTSVQVTGIEDRSGYAGPWAVRAYAVCVNR